MQKKASHTHLEWPESEFPESCSGTTILGLHDVVHLNCQSLPVFCAFIHTHIPVAGPGECE